MGLLSNLFGRKAGLRIVEPRVAAANFLGAEGQDLVLADRPWLSEVFGNVHTAEQCLPECDLLLLYATLSGDGTVAGTEHSLRDCVRRSGAKVVVVAAENTEEACVAAGAGGEKDPANLVLTLSRRGEAFGAFFQRLFATMKDGKAMPKAWAAVAGGPADAEDQPETVFACELGDVSFG